MYDPHDLWDWDAERGYVTNDRDDGGPFHPFRRYASRTPEEIAAESAAEAEEVSINGFIAAIRTHLPTPGKAGEGAGAAGGTVVCTQALHVLRALFEDLHILDAPHTFARRGADESRPRLWRQLRTAQLRDLIMQLAVVVDTLGVAPPNRTQRRPFRRERENPTRRRRRARPERRGARRRRSPRHPRTEARGPDGRLPFRRRARATARSARRWVCSTRWRSTRTCRPCSRNIRGSTRWRRLSFERWRVDVRARGPPSPSSSRSRGRIGSPRG